MSKSSHARSAFLRSFQFDVTVKFGETPLLGSFGGRLTIDCLKLVEAYGTVDKASPIWRAGMEFNI
jgi:hypothetical protein